jgi:polyhydroxyalkanoate synthase subunit PhaC
MEKWIFDSPDVPGETFRQFMKDCYQKNLLIQSKMELGGRRVDLKKITMPLLNFYGQFDHLVPPEACNRIGKEVGSRDTEDICLDTGHIGIYVSSKCQEEFAPKIIRWLKERDAPIKRNRSPRRRGAETEVETNSVPAERKNNPEGAMRKRTGSGRNGYGGQVPVKPGGPATQK